LVREIMNWLSLTLEADARHAEVLSNTLLQLGALSVDIADARAGTDDEQAIFGEPDEPMTSAWRASRVSGLFPADADIAGIVISASSALHLPAAQFTVSNVPDQDWVRLAQSQFAPIQISSRLWIVPSWHTPPDSCAINIVLDPGLAFGTGSHPTTRLCLRWLDEHIKGGEAVLDYGCGSGILAIAALKLGASRAFGVDSDPQAVLAGQMNAEENRVQAAFYAPQAVPQFKADIVLSNILSNPLKLLAPLLADATRDGGVLVLSGILTDQARDVENAYREWFDMHQTSAEEGWVCLCGTKRTAP
jgi:ribosomal protein L11 methyltransferase